MKPLLSVAIPAYNEGLRLRALIGAGGAFAQAADLAFELIIVDDGSRPEHVAAYGEVLRQAEAPLTARGHRIRVVAHPVNRGKGAAIRTGWSAADPRSDWLCFLDADGAVSAAEFVALARNVLAPDPPELIAASRVRMAGRRVERSLLRHLQGRVFATLAELTLSLGFYDSQCGAKIVAASHLRSVLGRLEEDRWMIDPELIVLLRQGGARCLEVPVNWADPGGSKVKFGIDPLKMLLGLFRLRRRLGRIREKVGQVQGDAQRLQ